MTAHTPGPWKFDQATRRILDSEDWYVAEVDDEYSGENAFENARLIAAAPALLAALEETLRSLEAHLDESCRDHNIKDRSLLCPCEGEEVKRARAAIAAAKGEGK